MNLIDNAKHQGKRKKLISALKSMGIESEQVLQAMLKVPRHYFLDSSFEDFAYQNKAFPIGTEQTISHPYTVAFQSEVLNINKGDKILEIGCSDGNNLNYLFNKLPKMIKDTSYSILKKNISDISNLSFKYKSFFVDINNNWLSPDKIRRITIITNKKMLLFNEMLTYNKIKIYNKYAKYPKISEFDNKFFNKKAKIYLGKNYSPKITQNDSLLDEFKYFFKCVKRNSKPVTDIEFASKILKILSKVS